MSLSRRKNRKKVERASNAAGSCAAKTLDAFTGKMRGRSHFLRIPVSFSPKLPFEAMPAPAVHVPEGSEGPVTPKGRISPTRKHFAPLSFCPRSTSTPPPPLLLPQVRV